MQGKKEYEEKLFNNFQLSNRVSQTNFYRCLKGVLDLDFFTALPRIIMGIAVRSVVLDLFSALLSPRKWTFQY